MFKVFLSQTQQLFFRGPGLQQNISILTALTEHRRQSYSTNRVLLISGKRIAKENRISETELSGAPAMIRPSLMDRCGELASANNNQYTTAINNTKYHCLKWQLWHTLCLKKTSQTFLPKIQKSDNWFSSYSQKCWGCFFWNTVYCKTFNRSHVVNKCWVPDTDQRSK